MKVYFCGIESLLANLNSLYNADQLDQEMEQKCRSGPLNIQSYPIFDTAPMVSLLFGAHKEYTAIVFCEWYLNDAQRRFLYTQCDSGRNMQINDDLNRAVGQYESIRVDNLIFMPAIVLLHVSKSINSFAVIA